MTTGKKPTSQTAKEFGSKSSTKGEKEVAGSALSQARRKGDGKQKQ